MRYLQQYEDVERQISGNSNSFLSKEECDKLGCLGKFFAKLANVLPLQEDDYACLREAGQQEDMLLLAVASMQPAKRNSAGFPVLFDAVCGYAKIDAQLSQRLQGKLRERRPAADQDEQAVGADLDI
jgi:hypothetical protein